MITRRAFTAAVLGLASSRPGVQVAPGGGHGGVPERLLHQVDGRAPAEAAARVNNRGKGCSLLTRTTVIVTYFSGARA